MVASATQELGGGKALPGLFSCCFLLGRHCFPEQSKAQLNTALFVPVIKAVSGYFKSELISELSALSVGKQPTACNYSN